MKKNKKTYNPNMVFGINGCLNVFKAKKLEIISIHLMAGGNADQNKTIRKYYETKIISAATKDQQKHTVGL